jgi:hypothetical protein
VSSPTSLLVRVFPDELHSDSHETGITPDERVWGEQYWRLVWPKDPQSDEARQAWIELARRFGTKRATWIVSAFMPLNLDRRPRVPGDGGPGDAVPVFPEVDSQPTAWSRAAYSDTLPSRWLAVGWRGDRPVVEMWGMPILDNLQLGPSPAARPVARPGEPSIESELQWLTDFDAAEAIGMGLRIRLPEPVSLGLDRLVVLGVKPTLIPVRAARRLIKVLRAHRFTDRCATIPQGEPTNLLSDSSRTRGAPDAGHEISFQEVQQLCTPPEPHGDVHRLAAALGVPVADFAWMTRGDDCEDRDARAMNTLLWPATLGYYADQMLTGHLSAPAYDTLRAHFIGYVHGRGPLPALRIGL